MMDPSEAEIVALVEKYETCVDFAPFGEGTSDEWIAKAESRLGFALPPSYKWFLKNFGGGQIAGQEIYSIYERDFETVNGGDIVYHAIVNARNKRFDATKLEICDNNGEEIFYFDIKSRNSSGEYVICRMDRIAGSDDVYALSFAEFLKKRILFLCK